MFNKQKCVHSAFSRDGSLNSILRSIERRTFLKYLPGKDPESSLVPIIVGVCAATVPSFTYRVFFLTGPPPKISKYRKVDLG